MNGYFSVEPPPIQLFNTLGLSPSQVRLSSDTMIYECGLDLDLILQLTLLQPGETTIQASPIWGRGKLGETPEVYLGKKKHISLEPEH